MRSRKAMVNIIAGLLNEAVVVICGFIVPRLILSVFGSSYNGITNSITQFLGYVSLLRAGVGGVTRAALFRPLAERNTAEISSIVNATDRFLKKAGVIFLCTLFIFATIYPFLVIEDFDWFFSFTLVIILGISTFFQYFFGLTYQFLLVSDQRQCIISYVQIISTILNTVLSFVLIKLGFGIHIVKLGSAIAFSMNPIIINLYVRKVYRIDKSVPPNFDSIKDRWDCFGIQVANFINANTDMLILTIFTNVREVSVYTVYHMVTSGVRKLLMTLIQSLGPAFGDMFAKGENERINSNIKIYELVTFSLVNILFSSTLYLMLSFVKLYTKGIEDIEYLRPVFSAVLIIATMFSVYRVPYQSIVEVIGHFKQTRNGSFVEAILNITVSVILVIYYGLVGVAIGTLCATVFRTIQYYLYVSRHIIKMSVGHLIKRIGLSFCCIGLVQLISTYVFAPTDESFIQWAEMGIGVFLTAIMITIIFEATFYGRDLKKLTIKIKELVN